MAQTTKNPRDILQYVDTFFGTRNGIKGEPVEDVNFTIETLTYMTPQNRADEIANLIVDRMRRQQQQIPFGVFECCAGIGGNTLAFLENTAIHWVVSYELRPERRAMLVKNITMYGLAANERAEAQSFVPEGPFVGVPETHKGVALYFDPPWLPPHIKGDECTKDDYVLEGIKIGDKTLEEWIDASRHTSMIVMRVPPGYRLQPTPGFTYESMLLGRKKNSLLIIAYPPSATPTSPIPAPIVDKPVTTGTGAMDQRWYDGLRNYLKTTLLPMVVPPKYMDKMVSDEAMKVWVPCFTHESYDPNIGHNYEELELVGDHAMEYNFMLYLYKHYPGLTPKHLSNLKSHYMSKPYQAQVGLRFGLNKWLRSRTVSINTHSFEDVLEAFFGALNIVGDSQLSPGAGNNLCYSLIKKLFEEMQIDMKFSKGKPKTIVKETLEQLKWGKSKSEEGRYGKGGAIELYENDEYQRTTTASIVLPQAGFEAIRSLGIMINHPELSRETGNTKKVASDKAYKSALERLRSYGITEEWVERNRDQRDMKNPELAPLLPSVKAKVMSEGYEGYYISKVQQNREGKYFQLIGILPDGKKVILEGSDKPLNETDGKRELLLKYLER